MIGIIVAVGNCLLLSQINGASQGDNFVWGAAMTLAWKELASLAHSKELQLGSNQSILKQVDNFNHASLSNKDLSPESYCLGAGKGQKFVDKLREECDAKFPQKSLDSLPKVVAEDEVIAYAYLFKNVMFPTAFTKKLRHRFEDEHYEGFYADEWEQKKNVKVVEYQSPQKFIAQLKLKGSTDELFVAMGYEDVPQIGQKFESVDMEDQDYFAMPMVQLEVEHEFSEFIGKPVVNKGLKGMSIGAMQEIIKFKLDEKGVQLENEALIGLTTAVPYEQEPKIMSVDSDFWLLMREQGRQFYFVARVRDGTWLTKAKAEKLDYGYEWHHSHRL